MADTARKAETMNETRCTATHGDLRCVLSAGHAEEHIAVFDGEAGGSGVE